MLKEILKEWLVANDYGVVSETDPDIVMFGEGIESVPLNVAALAQFILDNPCTD